MVEFKNEQRSEHLTRSTKEHSNHHGEENGKGSNRKGGNGKGGNRKGGKKGQVGQGKEDETYYKPS